MHTLKLDSSSLFLDEVNVWLKDAQENTLHFLEYANFVEANPLKTPPIAPITRCLTLLVEPCISVGIATLPSL